MKKAKIAPFEWPTPPSPILEDYLGFFLYSIQPNVKFWVQKTATSSKRGVRIGGLKEPPSKVAFIKRISLKQKL